jgi:hypothetical protein
MKVVKANQTEDFMLKSAEKMSQIEILNHIKQQAAQRNTRKGFEKVMNAVPDVEPENPDDRIDFKVFI